MDDFNRHSWNDEAGHHRINPASGLPMIGMGTGVDSAGNPFGSSGASLFASIEAGSFNSPQPGGPISRIVTWLLVIGGSAAAISAFVVLIFSLFEKYVV